MTNWTEKDLKEFAHAWFKEGWKSGTALSIFDVSEYFERRWKKMKEVEEYET